MAINHPTWVAGTAAQRLISVTKLNQLSADACNTTDDIHTQYPLKIDSLSFYSGILYYLVAGETLNEFYELDYSSGTADPLSNQAIHADPLMKIAEVSFKVPAGITLDNLHIEYDACKTATDLVQVWHKVTKAGAIFSSTKTTITDSAPTYANHAFDIDVSTFAEDDIISVIVAMYIDSPASGNSILAVKNVKVYFEE